MTNKTIQQIHDELLVLKCQTGDAASFEELIERWHKRLLGFVLRRTDGHQEAVDIAQEVWMVIARKISKLDDPAAFPAWSYRIAAAKCADWVRIRKRDRVFQSELEAEVDLMDRSGDRIDTGHDEIQILRTAIRQLPKDYRIILTMFYLDELSTTQIGETLNIPVGTVKSRLHTARNKLKERIERNQL